MFVVSLASAVATFALIGGASGVIAASIVGALAVCGLERLSRSGRLGGIGGSRSNSLVLSGSSTPLVVDLIATALRSGQPLPTVLCIVAELAEAPLGPLLDQVGRMLQLGADPTTAWARVLADPTLAEIARAAIRSAESGIRLADDFEQLATDLRAERRGAAEVRAGRAGTWAIAPLGLCFLPAFVCLGIAPIVVGVAHDVFARVGR
ncbi:Type II secretion system (T2SS), protein F [Frankineae bacterium MT45]|nr:Type II secretion system (T2SS), protein F [Frankineae bacterium MT45]